MSFSNFYLNILKGIKSNNSIMDHLEFKLDALDGAISYPVYKEEKDVCTIEVDNFDHLVINEIIKSNDKLNNFEGATINLLLEIVQLISDHKTKFHIMLHQVMNFYWNGLPILVIKYKGSEASHMIYVSVKRYKDTLNETLKNNKIGKIIGYGLMGLLALIGIGFGITYLSKHNSTDTQPVK